MRILHLGDTHLGLRMPARGASPGWTRAADHLDAFRAALGPAIREEVDAVVHAGDLFNRSRPPLGAMAAAADLLRAAARRVPVLVIPGNHDRRGLRRYLPWPCPGLLVADEPTRVRLGEATVLAMPFSRDARAWSHLARAAGGADLLVAHQAFEGARVPGVVFRAGHQRDTVGAEHLPPGIRHVLCGHIHPRQVLDFGGARIVCPGSTERTAFSERGEAKGAALWTLGRTIEWRFTDLPSRPMAVVRAEADLAGVTPGALVRLAGPARLESEVLARGGWLVGPPAPTPTTSVAPEEGRQRLLFGTGRSRAWYGPSP